MKRQVLLGWFVAGVLGCGGAGNYGYSRTYQPLGNESDFVRRANNDAVYDEVRRMPDRFANQLISWFGVVTHVERVDNGNARVALSLRTHQERHLCQDENESSCRVTVSENEVGPFTAIVHLSPEDSAGENRLQPGALMRVYGTVVQGEYDAQGGPIVQTQFYRQWPRGQYVTTAAAASWRR